MQFWNKPWTQSKEARTCTHSAACQPCGFGWPASPPEPHFIIHKIGWTKTRPWWPHQGMWSSKHQRKAVWTTMGQTNTMWSWPSPEYPSLTSSHHSSLSREKNLFRSKNRNKCWVGASTGLSSPHVHKKEEVCTTNAAIKEKEELGTRSTQGFCDTKIPAQAQEEDRLFPSSPSEEAWEHPWSLYLGLGPNTGSVCCLFKGLKQEACEGDKRRRPKSQKKLENKGL